MPDSPLRTVLFDLDGTLVDTAPDLAYALNTVLQEQGRPALPYASIRPQASHGAKALIALGFDLASEDPAFEALRQRLLEIYAANLTRQTRLFAGMEELLQTLPQMGMNWGVVTNKPGFLTEPLLQQLGLSSSAACIISGDSTTRRKPDPQPLLHACELIGSNPAQCVYIGDAERDIEAGKQAGMKTLVALFGYIQSEDRPEHWGADASIAQVQDILTWIQQHNQGPA